jgi:hypothetical protein
MRQQKVLRRKHDYVGRKVRLKRTMRNGAGEVFEKDEIMIVVTVGPGMHLRRLARVDLTLPNAISRVKYEDVEIIE